MKKIILATTIILASQSAYAQGYKRVDGYTRNDGTYVQPHYRTNADNHTYNNFSTQGNTNMFTGQRGTVEPKSGIGYNDNRGRGQNNSMFGLGDDN